MALAPQFDDIPLTQYVLRTIDQFDDQREILAALRDAVIENRDEWSSTGKAHGNIDFNAVLISAGGLHGYLVDPLSPPDGRCSSVRYLDRTRRRRIFYKHHDPKFDYRDDLESFYHVLGWICCVFEGPHLYRLELPGLLRPLLKPTSIMGIALKRNLILSDGYEPCQITSYFADDEVFPRLLKQFQAIIRGGYEQTDSGRRLSPAQKRAEAEQDYSAFIEAIDEALWRYDAIDLERLEAKVKQEESWEGWWPEVEELEQSILEWFKPEDIRLEDHESSDEESVHPLTPEDGPTETLQAEESVVLPHPSVFGATEYPLESHQFSVDESGFKYIHLPHPSVFEGTIITNE